MKFKNRGNTSERKCSKEFVAPTKAQATTGHFMSAGDKYGIGLRQPVGSTKVSTKPGMPMTSFCMNPEEAING